ncbi:aspartyl aminopeptidase [Octopus bimaculoides]|uniref:Aspartyl aminopeptidase n=1 Tax=Octopus bimaculoides TaxID=37653 RepID=A0A0L8IA05_OCTBM|nr:aspartyl aminopeptidase [Octopus bimaculoides]|eukprot:XP_014783051.1 PREDICTED: aspartyl aminopeptidase-like [Octopus bimaculoides]
MAFSRETVLSSAEEFLKFVNASPSPYHATDALKTMLKDAGFEELRESNHWTLENSKKYFLTRNESTLIAFAVGAQYKPGNGFSLVGAHVDSPCLKVKPVSRKERHGYLTVGVQCYGGGIWASWLDRDLTVAGRVMIDNGKGLEHRLVNVKKPILRIPHLAIHLQRDINDKLTLNKEDHLNPILATKVQAHLNEENSTKSSKCEKHHSVLMKLLSQELQVEPNQIMDFELCLADTQPAVIGGICEEFIFSPRLDNLVNSFCACKALIASCQENSLAKEKNIRMIALYDNEEVGSDSAQGAASLLTELVMRRICQGTALAFEEAIPKSYHLSADQAHAVHPNYGEKHEDLHHVEMHKGYVLKINANQRYASTAITCAILRKIAAQANVPLQDFVIRNDSVCGSTIGPILSQKIGIPTVDVGSPQLSMHSIREQCCTTSIAHGIALFEAFFKNYPEIFDNMKF